MWILFMFLAAVGIANVYRLFEKTEKREDENTYRGLVILGCSIYSGLSLLAAAVSYGADTLASKQ